MWVASILHRNDHPVKRSRPARGHSHSPAASSDHPLTQRGWGATQAWNVFNFSKRLQVSRAELQRRGRPPRQISLVSLYAHAVDRRRGVVGTSLWDWQTDCPSRWTAGRPHPTTTGWRCSPEQNWTVEQSAEWVDETLNRVASLPDNCWMISTFFASSSYCNPLDALYIKTGHIGLLAENKFTLTS